MTLFLCYFRINKRNNRILQVEDSKNDDGHANVNEDIRKGIYGGAATVTHKRTFKLLFGENKG